jgi:hypothetical protein
MLITIGKQLKDELTEAYMIMINNLIEINSHDQVIQIVKKIEYVLEYLNEEDDDEIEMRFK